MMLFPMGASRVRRAVTTAAVLALVSAGSAAAQQTQAPAGQTQPQQEQAQQAAPPAATTLTFTSPAGVLFHQIKQDRTADFEWLMERLKEAMLKSEDPVHKQQAAGMRVFKNLDPMPQTGNIMYILMLNPVVPEADYSMVGLLNMVYKVFPDQQQEIYKRVQGAFGGNVSRINLQPVADFSK